MATPTAATVMVSRPGQADFNTDPPTPIPPRDWPCGDNNPATSLIAPDYFDYGTCYTVDPMSPYWDLTGSEYAADSEGFTAQVVHVLYSTAGPLDMNIDGGMNGGDTNPRWSFTGLPAGTMVEAVSDPIDGAYGWAEFAVFTWVDPVDTEIHEWWIETTSGRTGLWNAERSSPIRLRNPDGTWADVSLVGQATRRRTP